MTDDPNAPDRDRQPSFIAEVTHLGRWVPSVDLFALFTLMPVPVLVLGCLFGGVFAWAGLIWIAGLIHVLDRLIRRAAPDAPEGSEFPAADSLSIALGVAHFAVLALAVIAVVGLTGLGIVERIVVFLGCGMFLGQVSNPNAHELIHRADKRLFTLGKWIYISLLYGQHVSAHRLVHHRYVATRDDPNTAVLGESFWAYLRQVWPGEFRAGWRAEQALRARRSATQVQGWRGWLGPYAHYLAGGLAGIMLVWIAFGLMAVAVYVLLCLYAQIQILLADYVQHYGLERRRVAYSYEPVSVLHSWDAPDPVSALWMLNAPRHSDHHAHPARPYPLLALGDYRAPGRPVLPYSLPVMATLALSPRIWHRLMDRRVKQLRARQAEL